jgi:Fe-S cluster assembly protein SufD
MSDFIQQAQQLSPRESLPWLASLKQAGEKVWSSSSMPTRKTEAWKYTRLRPLETGAYLNAAQPAQVDEALTSYFNIDGLNAWRLVFVDGVFQPSLSDQALLKGCEVVRFSDANADQAKLISGHLGSLINRQEHVFAALNDQWANEGVFVHIAKNTRIERPIQLVWLTTREERSYSLAQRLLVLVEPGAEASIVEQFCSTDEEQNCFTNGLTELILQEGAKLNHFRLNLEEEHALHIGGVHAGLGRNAILESFYLAMGSTLKRLDVVVNFQGEGAHCEMNGVYLPHREQHVDFHTCMEHAVPNCTSNEVFRGIISDSAQAVFNGRIHIHRDAQKTSARLSNKNLLTSNKAEIDTKPELEIYADDVQCAHGATVAQLDEQLLYYFLSRGISRHEAEVMLSFGFINELLSKVKESSIGDYLRPMLATHFAEDPKLVRHIA